MHEQGTAKEMSKVEGRGGSDSKEGPQRGAKIKEVPQQGAETTGAPQRGAMITGAPQRGATTTRAPQQGAETTGAPQLGAMTTGAPQRGAMTTRAPQQGAETTGAPQGGSDIAGAPTWEGADPGVSSKGPPGTAGPHPGAKLAVTRVAKRLAGTISRAGQLATDTVEATANRAGASVAMAARAGTALASAALRQAADGKTKRLKARADRCERRGALWPPGTAESVPGSGTIAPVVAPDPQTTVWHRNIQYGSGQVHEVPPLWCDSCTKPHPGRDVEPCSTYGCHRRACLLFTSAYPGGLNKLAVDRTFRRCNACNGSMFE